MTSIFVNTSGNISLGLIDSSNRWIDYIATSESKASEILHTMIYELLEKHNYVIEDVDNIVTVAGPGSYTGLRLGEGLAQVLSLANINHYSFYLTDVFEILNIKNYLFYANAFKGESFLYKDSQAFLTKDKEFLEKHTEDLYSINGEDNSIEVRKLVFEHIGEIMSFLIMNKVRKQILYYRSIEAEYGK